MRTFTISTITILVATVLAHLKTFGQESNNKQSFPVDQIATFPGGINKFYEYIYTNLKYPKDVNQNKKIGIVYIEFLIKEDGYIDKDSIRSIPISELKKSMPPGIDNSKPKITDVPESCKREAIRVILTSPRWNPGNLKGNPQQQKFVVPVKFGI